MPTRRGEPADLHVSLTWNTKTDVDLWVLEPDGTKCFWNNPKTKNGGEYVSAMRYVVTGVVNNDTYNQKRTWDGAKPTVSLNVPTK